MLRAIAISCVLLAGCGEPHSVVNRWGIRPVPAGATPMQRMLIEELNGTIYADDRRGLLDRLAGIDSHCAGCVCALAVEEER